jgi:hypothetical protein
VSLHTIAHRYMHGNIDVKPGKAAVVIGGEVVVGGDAVGGDAVGVVEVVGIEVAWRTW